MAPLAPLNHKGLKNESNITELTILIPDQGSMVAVSPRGGARIGDSLTYLCPVGEVPLGETSQTCTKSGTWSGLPIACKPVDCGKVPGLADGDIHILDGRTSWGARVSKHH